MARPMPRPAPVTRTPLPCTSLPDTAVSGTPVSGPPMSGTPGERDAAIDHEDLTRQPGRVLGEQESHHAGDVLRHAESLERVRRGNLVLTALVERGGEPGLHYSRGDPVDTDTRTELDRELGGDVREHRLARAVEADAGRR